MPALRGSLTYARFFVDTDRDVARLTDDVCQRFMRAIRLRAMRPLEPDEEEPERSGWCKLGEPFTTELGYEDVFLDGFVNLGFRTDKWVIPATALRARLREAEAAYLTKKGREKLSRREKAELKLLTLKKLRKTMTPATRVVDLSWSLEEGIVRFFSHAPKPAGAMSEVFAKTFGLKLVPEAPYTLAARLGLSKGEAEAWGEVEIVRFGDGESRDLGELAAEEEA